MFRNYVLARIGQRSTWVGIIALGTSALGLTVEPALAEALVNVGAAVGIAAGALLVHLKEPRE